MRVARWCVLFHLVLLLSPAFAGSFTAPERMPLSSSPRIVQAAELNGDGRADIVYTDWFRVYVRLSSGVAEFQPEVPYDSGFELRSFVVADVTGDGVPDLLVGGSFLGAVRTAVFPGRRDGTFAAALHSTVLPNPGTDVYFHQQFYAFQPGDFNGDGKLDLVLVAGDNYSLYVSLGNGNGEFGAASALTRFNSNPTLLVGDLNRDHRLDFICMDGLAAEARVFLGNGDGTFNGPSPYKGIRSGVLYDLNQDGILDLVATHWKDASLEFLAGKGDGTFSAGSSIASGVRANGIVGIVDINRDGYADILLASINGVSVSLGLGGLNFGSSTTYPTAGEWTAVVGDFDGDQYLDVAAPASDSLALLRGKGDGTFDSAVGYDIGPSLDIPEHENHVNIVTPTSAVVVDLDRDGIPDIVVGTSDGPVRVLRGTGAGRFSLVPPAYSGLPPTSRGSTAFGDFNGDSRLDAVVTGIDVFNLQMGNADGSFQQPLEVRLFDPRETRLLTAAIPGDFNGDGMTDLAVSDRVVSQPGFAIYLRHATGFFTPPSFSVLEGGKPVLADFNRDGRLDAAFLSFPGMHVLLGNGNGTMQPAVPYDIFDPDSAHDLVAADADGDGKLDLLAPFRNGLAIFFGFGDGNFSSAITVTIPTGVATVAVGDVNLDGKPDLIVTSSVSIAILQGDGNRGFALVESFFAGRTPRLPSVADVNCDGAADIVVPNMDPNNTTTISVFLNKLRPPVPVSTCTLSLVFPVIPTIPRTSGLLDQAIVIGGSTLPPAQIPNPQPPSSAPPPPASSGAFLDQAIIAPSAQPSPVPPPPNPPPAPPPPPPPPRTSGGFFDQAIRVQ